jgi:glycerophosphoryl diester phosphodiesterase
MAKSFLPLDNIGFNCIGHRGACGHAPENTLSSFDLALEMGCTWIELDVYCVENELLVIHDDDLERTTNGTGKVMGQDLSYLRSLDAGNGQQIPTLGEVCELVNHRAGINIELKGPGTAAPVSAFVDSCRQNGWTNDHFLVSSFDHVQLAEIRGMDDSLNIGCLFSRPASDMTERCQKLSAYSLNINARYISQEIVSMAHDSGLKVYAYTVNDLSELDRMLAIGADGIFTDFPDRIYIFLEAS